MKINNDKKHIDERKDKLYTEMMVNGFKKRDEKALKRQAAKEVRILNTQLFHRNKQKELPIVSNILDELDRFLEEKK
jgi:hypothetical protein